MKNKKTIRILFKNGHVLDIENTRLPKDKLTTYSHCTEMIEAAEKEKDYKNDYIYFRGKEVALVLVI